MKVLFEYAAGVRINVRRWMIKGGPLMISAVTIPLGLMIPGCKTKKVKPEEYEIVSGKAWDTTLASTLGRPSGSASRVPCINDPVYLDFNRDGKLNVEGGKQVSFDINGDGLTDIVHEWNTKDAQLVYDVNSNNKIDDGREIMNETGIDGTQNKYRNGWEKARDVFDINKDDVIDGDELRKVKVWTDADGNGVVDKDELKTAETAGITRIDIGKMEFLVKIRM